MLIAGHETTSTALTWTLWMLAKAPEVQAKLRCEVRKARVESSSEGLDDLDSRVLDSLPYLDAVTVRLAPPFTLSSLSFLTCAPLRSQRECIRLEPPVTSTIRQAAHDDFIPLSKPIPSASDPRRTIASIPVKKGQFIFIPIRAVGLSRDVFGDDAHEFRPERWVESDEGTGKKIEGGVGLTGNNLSFLAGPMGCIGYKVRLSLSLSLASSP